ncbi:hypothetical protein GCM10020331_035990 [Ectobacillus funiculus]
MKKEGFRVTYLPVNEMGRISIDDMRQALTDETILVTVMFGNNEVGTIQPIQEIGELLREHPAYFSYRCGAGVRSFIHQCKRARH